MKEPDLDRLLKAVAGDDRLSAPPPLERMWRNIEARTFGPIPLTGARPRRWLLPAAIAASLLAGTAIGYGGARLGPALPVPVSIAAEPPPPAEAPAPDPFVGVAGDYLEQTTALLVTVGGDRQADPISPAIRDRARDLLSTTRFLLDAGVGDPALNDLLQDLELVLVQIARLSKSPPTSDTRFVNEALDQRDVLPRLTLLLADSRGVNR